MFFPNVCKIQQAVRRFIKYIKDIPSVVIDRLKVEHYNKDVLLTVNVVPGVYTNEFLKATARVQSNSPEIITLARNITQGLTTDYEKTLAIHDYV